MFTERGDESLEKALGELASFRKWGNRSKASKGDEVRIVGVRNFQQHFWAPLHDLDVVTTDGPLPEADTLKENDLLFVRSNGNLALIGRSLLIGKITEKVTFSGFTIRARLHDASIVPEYICHFLKSSLARETLIEGGIGANIKSLNQTTLARLLVPLPSHSEQSRIAVQLDELDAGTQRLTKLYERKLSTLRELHQALLHQAFSGRLGGQAG